MTNPDDAGPDDIPGRTQKSPTAFRTISEVADDLHIPQHVLRFWETKFPQVKPLKRGGGRRYYRPDDIALLCRISDLLYIQGYTIKGVQRLLRDGDPAQDPPAGPAGIETGAAEIPEDAETGPPDLPAPDLPAPDLPASDEPVPDDPTPDAGSEDPPDRLRATLGRILRGLEELRAGLDR